MRVEACPDYDEGNQGKDDGQDEARPVLVSHNPTPIDVTKFPAGSVNVVPASAALINSYPVLESLYICTGIGTSGSGTRCIIFCKSLLHSHSKV